MWMKAITVAIVATAIAFFSCQSSFATLRTDALINERLRVPDDGQAHEFVFTSTTNNLYDFQSFGDGFAIATLYEEDNDDPLISAEGFFFTYRLRADTTYVLSVVSEIDSSEVEIMRSTLGRSFAKPIELTELTLGYDKAIARAYDTHWFKFIAPSSGIYVIRSISEINMVGYLLDSQGRTIALSDNLYSPYCLDFRMIRQLTQGEVYYVRISGRGGETGNYSISVAISGPTDAIPTSISMSESEIVMQVGEQHQLSAAFEPFNAITDAVWMSSDNSVASVDRSGNIVANDAGSAWIIVSGLANTSARCLVTVTPKPVTGISLEAESFEMHVDEMTHITVTLEPENATNRGVIITSSDESIVAVGRRNNIIARGAGVATITATSIDGGHEATATVTVNPARPVYRALVMAQQRYADGRTRTGAINTAQGIVDLLNSQSYAPEVTMRLDTTRQEAISAIRDAFDGAKSTDISILYLSGHGGVTGDKAWIEFNDGKRLTARQLERELRSVKGIIVLIIDSCQSGAFISTDYERYNSKLLEAFSAGSSTRLISSKYRILTSSCASQDSYRFSADGTNTENSMSTAFGRSLTESGGFDMIGDRRTAQRADLNGDHIVTLHEAYLYTSRRVRQFLSRANVVQDVQVYPAGSQFQL
ncbi:MAG: Ig-like domain-containing protein, partial [Clostridia bacterium]|nr:Ig-like domain-containing protein [Clostridia bacterium]